MLASLTFLVLAFPPMTGIENLPASHVGVTAPAGPEAALVTSANGAWVFWMDDRRDRTLGQTGNPRADLWMSRVRPNGSPVSEIGTLACAAPPATTFSTPRAVMTRNGPVVAWMSLAVTANKPALFVAPMRPDGGLDCPAAPLTPPEPLRTFDLGSDGQSLLAVWGTPTTVRGRLLTASGVALDAGAYDLSTEGTLSPVAVTGLDGGFLVGWVSALDGQARVRRGEPMAAEFSQGEASRLALGHRAQGPVVGLVTTAGDLDVNPLDLNGQPGLSPGALLGPVREFLMTPLEGALVLVVGSADGGAWFSAAGDPVSGASIAPGPVPVGHRPLALSAIGTGALSAIGTSALAVTQAVGRPLAPLSTLHVTVASSSALAWDGGAVLSATSDQFTPSVAWAGGAWLVAWDEADRPSVPGVVTHAAELATDGQLSALADLSLPVGAYLGLVSGGDRMAALSSSASGSALLPLELDGGLVTVGATKIAGAAPEFRNAALGTTDALMWTDAMGNGFGAQHTGPGINVSPDSYLGTPGRCAAQVGRKFYLPVANDGLLLLLVFDGDAPVTVGTKPLMGFTVPVGTSACAAANGTDVLIAWSEGPGIVAYKFDTLGASSRLLPFAFTDSGDQLPVVAAVTGGWVLVWESGTPSAGHELRATFVTTSGLIEEPVTQAGLGTVFEERRPWLVSSPSGLAALTWSAFDKGTGVTRTMARVIGAAPLLPDAGAPDAGDVDGGGRDAGGLDGGAPDAGPADDAGLPAGDGGSTAPDAGLPGDQGPISFTSCACGATPAAPVLLGLGLALAARRRRRGG